MGKGGLLQEWAEKRGYRVSWGGADVLDEVRAEVQGRWSSGQFDERFYTGSLAFAYGERAQLPGLRTVIVVSFPRPAHLLRFACEEGCINAVIPPTYLWYEKTTLGVLDELGRILGPEHRVVRLQSPLKSVAVRLGLAAFGRNNITYVPGFGSYHQLVGCATDAELGPAPTARRSGPELCAECEKCTACRRGCPTGAIGEDRILLHAERCLTYFNEFPGPWPVWLQAEVHHCLVGCLVCQQVCPQNAGLLRFETLPEVIPADETARILRGAADDYLQWERVKARLEATGLVGYETVISRNLRALRAAGERAAETTGP